jgi:NADPH:quinone reductase-like Zn-dependent oxidoreductase
MKVVRLRQPFGLDCFEVTTMPQPGPPKHGEILVRMHASSLNYHDYFVATGRIKTADGRIPLSDGAGEVLAAGEGVDMEVGAAVVSVFHPNWSDGLPLEGYASGVPGDGEDGYAREYVLAPAAAFTRAPAGYTHAEAATLTCAGLTAWRALVVEGGLKAGDSVLVQGTGGVSIFALQFARAMGATVIATSSSDEKLARLKTLGADHVINYRTTENWGEAALALTGGRGVDHVVEIGGAGTLPQSISAVRIGGHISLIGVLAGLQGPLPTVLLMARQVRLIGINVGTQRQQRDMIAAVERIGLRPVIDRHFPLDALADAYRYQESARHFGKIVIDI